MKNYLSRALALIPMLILSLNLWAQEIVQVGVGEYFTTYRTSDGKLYTNKWGNNSTVAIHQINLSNVIDVDGAQYTNVALTADGKVYVVGVSGSVNAYANLVATDNQGNPFVGNTKVYGLYQCYLSIRDGKVWYWGIGDVLNKNGGANINFPMQLQHPTGKTIVKLEMGSATTFGSLTYVYGLASDGTVWQWGRNSAAPTQVTFPGNIAEDICMVGHHCFVVKTSNNLYTWGLNPNYAGGLPSWQVSGVQSIKSKWEVAGAVFPIKEMKGNYNSFHIIDANDNMFACGTNAMGELGNGKELTPWRTAPTPWNWDWNNNVMMEGPLQIPGKFKNLQSGNTVAFYFYVQDMGGNWYSWGRNKALCLGNGITLSIDQYAAYPNAYTVPAPTLVTPLTQTWRVINFNPNAVPPPFAHAGINQYITTNSTTLYGSSSFQQDGSIVAHQWTKISGPAATIVSPNAANTEVTGLSNGTYVFQVQVTNNLGVTATQKVTVVVSSQQANQAPVVNAGADQTITLPTNSVTLTGTATDSDGSISTYTWRKVSGGSASITATTTATTNVTGLAEGVYKFEFKATDNNGASALDTVQITVLPAPNVNPTANAGADFTIQLPTNSVTLNGNGTDTDGTIVSYQWRKVSGGTATITSANAATTTVTGMVQGNYRFELKVTDDRGATAIDMVDVTVLQAANVAPTANAGSDVTIQLPTNSTTLNGSGTDTDGSIVSYSWRKVTGGAVTITSPTSANTSITGMVEGTYRFELTVTDDRGATATDRVDVTVLQAANVAPTANAGSGVTIQLPTNSTTLNGSGTDTDGSIVSYSWRKVTGGAVTITSPSSANTTITGLVEGTYRFELTVTDDRGATATDRVDVTVLQAANVAPTANAGSGVTIQLPTNSTTLNGSGTDTDGSIVSYSWRKVTGGAVTITSPSSANTTITGLVEGTYRFELTVTDDRGATATDRVDVTVLQAANVAPTANAGSGVTIQLPTNSTTLNGSGTDTDGSIVSYSWRKVTGGAVTITSPSSANTTITGLVEGTYRFELTVTDDRGATATDRVDVTVLQAANVAPTANAGSGVTIQLPTNSTTLNGSGTDTDGSIVSYSWRKVTGGAVTITSPSSANTTITGLVEGTYRFELTVTDDRGATATDRVDVTVLQAANVAPTANAGSGVTIQLPTNSTTLNGSGTDTDGSIVSYSWRKVTGGAVTITSPSSANTTITGLVEGTYRFELTVTDDRGATATDRVDVTVLQAANVAPTANAGSGVTIQLPTNSTTLNGSGTDTDGSIVSYSWRKVTGGVVTITDATAAITTITGMVEGTYRFELTVTDDRGGIATDRVDVVVLQAANVAPTANAGADVTIQLPTNSTTLNGSGTDTDGSIVSYSWRKVAGGAATITSATSAATTVTGLVQGSYTFELTVTDDRGGIATDRVDVVVLQAANVAPTANAGADVTIQLPTNSTTLNGSGTDTDGSIVSYSWRKVTGGVVTITDATAATTTVTGLVQGTYRFELTVTDDRGATATDRVDVTVLQAANVAPTANAGADITIQLPVNTVTLQGLGTDTDGSIISYTWRKVSGGAATITNPSNEATTVTGLVQGTYTFELTVKDDRGDTATDRVDVTVLQAANIAPTANAGADITIQLPVNTVTLEGVGTDTDGTIVSYSWRKVTGGGAATIANTNAATTTVTGLAQGTYRFELTVTDDRGGTATDRVDVVVLEAENIVPTANAGTDITIQLPVNTVTLNGSGNDTDGTIVSYSWRKVNGTSANITSPSSASTTVTGLTEGTYRFELTVMDNRGGVALDTVRVIVQPEANTAPTADAGPDQTITLPTNYVTLIGSGTDTDGTIVAYKWTKISGGVASIINNASLFTPVNNLEEGVYEFELEVTDDLGATATDIVMITVLPQPSNLPPVANAGVDIVISLPVDSTMLFGNGTDPDGSIYSYRWIKIDGPAGGQITSPDAQNTMITGLVEGLYNYQVIVTDNRGATARDTVKVTVLPDYTNLPPTANAGDDVTIYLPDNSVSITGSGTDADGDIIRYQWSMVAGPVIPRLNNQYTPTVEVADLQQGVYKFELIVWDNAGAYHRDTMQLNVGSSRNPNIGVGETSDEMTIYPNPVASRLNLNIKTTTTNRRVKITVYDIQGHRMMQKYMLLTSSVNVDQINVEHLPSGTYIVRMVSEDKPPVNATMIKR